MNSVGFYGKLACRGDFVSRGLPGSFVQPWDQWLAAGVQTSQRQLGEAWLPAYLVSPLWRFALAPGLCGPQAVVGVLMPSIDRVGRYFPLTLAQPLPADTSLAAVLGASDDWFDAAEGLLLASLEAQASFEDFDAAVSALAPLEAPAARPVQVSLGGLQRLTEGYADDRLRALADSACAGMSLWWGKGSAQIAPGLLRCQGLPRSDAFGAFILGKEAPCR
ncbi:type VI secretion system-associated protein TagF [Pseudomonas cremoricolorata]|uniref:Type VI secretion system protein ImpM n=1 Tax=Pseudomonas cremoricolorata TaxID=157783 RepID=A0A089WH52_9PSED|nr:type VI secretion system-associated protein TagF [Pseudomonas cremoricolorata]AIR88600.1 type VI secretion system protein ImpM [Pseudomonas cremoricolorata]